MKLIGTILLGIYCIFSYVFFNSWKLWIYIDNGGVLTRIYMGKEKSLYDCAYNALVYIDEHSDFIENPYKFFYVCGKKCDDYEKNCTYSVTSEIFDKNRFELLDEGFKWKEYLREIKKIYNPEYFTYQGRFNVCLYRNMDFFGILDNPDKAEFFMNYEKIGNLLIRYQSETLRDDLNLYLSPTGFETILNIQIEPNY